MQEIRDVKKYFVGLNIDRQILYDVKGGRKLPDSFFAEELNERYPRLLKWKDDRETFKNFYLRMMKYIFLLREQQVIPYIPVSDFNPETFFLNEGGYSEALIYSLELGDKDLIDYLFNKGAKVTVYTFEAIGRIGSIKLLQYILPRSRTCSWLLNTLQYARRFGNQNLVNYLLQLGIKE